MAIYNTPVNKAMASRLYSDKSLSNLDLDNSKSKSFSTYNTVSKLNSIVVYISSALGAYTKV